MASGPAPDVTQLLAQWSSGDQAALEKLLPLVYGELRRLASAYLRRERSNHTLQSTALVHEAFMRMVHQQDVQWKNRAHFFAIAAQMIRRILVDYARSQHAEKRGSGAVKLALDEAMAVPQAPATDVDLLGLNDALDRLANEEFDFGPSYKLLDYDTNKWQVQWIDVGGMAAENLRVIDLNQDGMADIVAIGRSTRSTFGRSRSRAPRP
jgi:RNA polymerase sigma factor (TIGR02999 family)